MCCELLKARKSALSLISFCFVFEKLKFTGDIVGDINNDIYGDEKCTSIGNIG